LGGSRARLLDRARLRRLLDRARSLHGSYLYLRTRLFNSPRLFNGARRLNRRRGWMRRLKPLRFTEVA